MHPYRLDQKLKVFLKRMRIFVTIVCGMKREVSKAKRENF
tara:strand:- start:175 stop:294 length:120 start_codon:yes stop_codon:yes gene_type:complete